MTFAAALEAHGFVSAGPFSGRHDRADGVKAYHCHDLVAMRFDVAVILVAGRRTACVVDPAEIAGMVKWLEPKRCNGPAAEIVCPVSGVIRDTPVESAWVPLPLGEKSR